MCQSSAEAHKVMGKRLNASQGRNPKRKIGITTTIMKCTHCGLIYSNPQPVPVDIQDHYGIPPEEYWKESYFKVDENYFKSNIELAKSFLHFKNGMIALDIGAGLGKAMIALERAGFDTYGFEPSIPFYERAISQMGRDPQKLKLSKIEDVNYEAETFDFITFGAVLEHLYNPSESILKAMSWLKPNGIIHIEVPSSDWLIGKFLNMYYKLKRTDYVTNLSPMHDPFHLYEFGLKSFQIHANLHNYHLEHHSYSVASTYLPKFLNYFLVPYMKRTNTGMQLTVWLRKIES